MSPCISTVRRVFTPWWHPIHILQYIGHTNTGFTEWLAAHAIISQFAQLKRKITRPLRQITCSSCWCGGEWNQIFRDIYNYALCECRRMDVIYSYNQTIIIIIWVDGYIHRIHGKCDLLWFVLFELKAIEVKIIRTNERGDRGWCVTSRCVCTFNVQNYIARDWWIVCFTGDVRFPVIFKCDKICELVVNLSVTYVRRWQFIGDVVFINIISTYYV